jgi:hypothetical protein
MRGSAAVHAYEVESEVANVPSLPLVAGHRVRGGSDGT